jgi:hypothetical protein
LITRFKEVSYPKVLYWLETGIGLPELEAWLEKNKSVISILWAHFDFTMNEEKLPSGHEYGEYFGSGLGVIEIYAKLLPDEKVHIQRVLFDQFEGVDFDMRNEAEYFQTYAYEYINELQEKTGLKINSTPSPSRDIF